MQIDAIAPIPATPPRAVAVADQLERAFLEEMLKYCGPGALSGDFSGGAGEDQFASFLTQEHAAQMSRRLDLGFGRMLGEDAA
ncbi:rod-binding protein [Paracoccus beibuensis]|uniref:rod-binding protein n=1 Tax=Paracoccus beibuensis TaxID=547602 RepID=UPI0022408339|nr:rod-binding protein [Paracoccus beibuensis]